MRFLIASDLHGSAHFARLLDKRIQAEQPQRILLLGDLLYHGPRNDLPEGYAPKEVIPWLNSLAHCITAVRGNCEAEVDQMVLDFPCMADYALVEDEGAQLFLTHGHVYGPQQLPKLPSGDKPWALLSGHTHVKVLERAEGLTLVNPGSVSIPKDGSHSYALYEDGAFTLKELDGTPLKTLHL